MGNIKEARRINSTSEIDNLERGDYIEIEPRHALKTCEPLTRVYEVGKEKIHFITRDLQEREKLILIEARKRELRPSDEIPGRLESGWKRIRFKRPEDPEYEYHQAFYEGNYEAS